MGVSLKMYFGLAQTLTWLTGAAAMFRDSSVARDMDLFVATDFVALSAARTTLEGSGIALAAQDAFWEDRGPFTGEVSPRTLREVGCAYVEVGHAERRNLFGEDDAVAARKARAVSRAGMTPVVCIGEMRRTTADAAARETVAQVGRILDGMPAGADLVFAYEPAWAIGAARPAETAWIVGVAGEVRDLLRARSPRARLVYGGSAGRGLFAEVAPPVDGLFLGRSAHDLESLGSVLAEVVATVHAIPAAGRADGGT